MLLPAHFGPPVQERRSLNQTLLSMKLLAFFLLVACLQLAARSDAQKISFSAREAPLEKVFRQIERQTDYVFFFDADALKRSRPVTVDFRRKTLAEVLQACFTDQPLTYTVIGNTIVVKEKAMVKEPAEKPISPPVDVRGKVTDEQGRPIEGASVLLKGTNTGVTTAADGSYRISIPDNAQPVLVFSFVGMESQEVNVAGRDNVAIVLKASVSQQQEIVIIGYNTQSRKKLTSAVATVSGTDLNERIATNPTTLMQGKLPGLQVIQGSGEPGNEGVQLRVRGVTTFSNAGSDPLVIVNGVPGNLSALNPNDIESITLLKDAAVTAMYGARGANGVIVVTTKKGKNGSFALQYNFNIGISKTAQLPETITNSAEFMELSNEARLNSGLQPLYTQAQIDLYRNATDRVKYPNHNWLDDVFVTASTKNHYLNLSGGANTTSYNLGFGFTDQPGTMLGFEYKKYTMSLGLSSKVHKRVTVGTDIQMRYGKRAGPRSGGGDIFLSTLAQSPLYMPRSQDGKWIRKAYSNELNNKNPVAIAKEDVRIQTRDFLLQGNLSIDVDIINGLKWENRGGVTFFAMKNSDFRPIIPLYYYSDMSSAGNLDVGSPGLSVARQDNVYGVLYSQLNYKRKFGDHTVGALGGAQQEYNNYSELNASRNAFATNLLRELNAGPADGQSNSGNSSEWAIRSFYGGVNYDYRDKYLFGASIRYDGTSRLPSNTRWGQFYSLSGGWRISEERFLQQAQWINDLKLRGSWGVVGNQNIIGGNANLDVYPYQPTLSGRNYAFGGAVATGFAATSLVDPTMVWESTRILDIGFDMAILNNKLSLTFDWFDKLTYDILRSSQVPLWLGLNPPTINNGSLRNRGIELIAGYRNVVNKDFSYDISANFQSYRNKLVTFGAKEISGNSIREEGHELDEFYLYTWDGIFQSADDISKSPVHPVTPTPGDIKIKDINGDNRITDADRTYVKGRYPSFQYSLNLGARWKSFDFSAQLYGSQGQKIYVSGWGIEPFRQGSVPTTDWRNRWTPTNPSNTMPKIYVADGYAPIQNYASTYFLKNGSFFRMRGIQLGYTVPVRIVSKAGAKSCRLYVGGDNVFTISKYPGLDPERVSTSGSYVTFPQIRTFTFGASVQF